MAPERAASEIGDVEQVARTTLQEVREAVASYRQPTLSNELHAAQEILAAAGIASYYEDDGNKDTLPSRIEAVLAWTVREGVTNVIQHSRPTCHILILTTFGRPGYLRQAMESGVVGFLLKDAPSAQLATAIRRVVAGERVVDPALARLH